MSDDAPSPPSPPFAVSVPLTRTNEGTDARLDMAAEMRRVRDRDRSPTDSAGEGAGGGGGTSGSAATSAACRGRKRDREQECEQQGVPSHHPCGSPSIVDSGPSPARPLPLHRRFDSLTSAAMRLVSCSAVTASRARDVDVCCRRGKGRGKRGEVPESSGQSVNQTPSLIHPFCCCTIMQALLSHRPAHLHEGHLPLPSHRPTHLQQGHLPSLPSHRPKHLHEGRPALQQRRRRAREAGRQRCERAAAAAARGVAYGQPHALPPPRVNGPEGVHVGVSVGQH